MRLSSYIFFCAIIFTHISYGMLRKHVPRKSMPYKPTINRFYISTEDINQQKVKSGIIPQLQICLCVDKSLKDTCKIASNTSNSEFDAVCSDNQKLFVEIFRLPEEIVKHIAKHLYDHNPQLVDDFSESPIKKLEYRSLMQDKLNNDKKLASMISVPELCLIPLKTVTILFDLTKHFQLNPIQPFPLDRQTIAYLCNLKQEILECNYFKNKLVSEEDCIKLHDRRYSFFDIINYNQIKPDHNQQNIVQYLWKTDEVLEPDFYIPLSQARMNKRFDLLESEIAAIEKMINSNK